MSYIFKSGKYAGHSLQEVAQLGDRRFIYWVVSNHSAPAARREADTVIAAWDATIEQINGCPICGNSSCDGDHAPSRPRAPRVIAPPPAPAPAAIDWRYVYCGDLTVSTVKLEELAARELRRLGSRRTPETPFAGLESFLADLDRAGHVAPSQRELARAAATALWREWPLG